jgi:hypothetical protein
VLNKLAFCQIFLGFSPLNYGFSLMFSIVDVCGRNSRAVLPGDVDIVLSRGVTQACFRAALKTDRQGELLSTVIR